LAQAARQAATRIEGNVPPIDVESIICSKATA
jgi:hypothetical protein